MSIILTYNVNGIRAALRKGFAEWVKSVNPDIICLQEIKADITQFDASIFENIGYYLYCHSAIKKGYSGVAILTKKEPKNVKFGPAGKTLFSSNCVCHYSSKHLN